MDLKEDVKTVETWLYHATEGAKLFLLKVGEKFPAGWFDSPDKAKAAPASGYSTKPPAVDQPAPADNSGEAEQAAVDNPAK